MTVLPMPRRYRVHCSELVLISSDSDLNALSARDPFIAVFARALMVYETPRSSIGQTSPYQCHQCLPYRVAPKYLLCSVEAKQLNLALALQ